MRHAARALLPAMLSTLLLGLLWTGAASAYVRFGVENHGAAPDSAFVEQVTTLIADIHKAFISALRLRVTSDVHVTLKFYQERDDYETDAKGLRGWNYVNAIPPAFYRHHPMEIWAVDSPDRELLRQQVVHESTHMFVHNLSENCPIWIHEGLAEAFQGSVLHQGKFILRPYAQRDQATKTQLQQRQLPDLAGIIDMDRKDWQTMDDSGQPVRAHSWSVCWFLLTTPEGRQLLNDLIRAHRPGRSPEKSSTLVDRYWRGGTKALEAAWRAWVPGRRTAMPLDIPNPEEPSLTTIIR